MSKKYYSNVIEYILKKYYNLKDDEVNYQTLELFFCNKERERAIINNLSDFNKYFNTVYQGLKNGCHWYKINIKEMEGLEKIYGNWQ